jgi:hypothetical protein
MSAFILFNIFLTLIIQLISIITPIQSEVKSRRPNLQFAQVIFDALRICFVSLLEVLVV